MESPHIEIQGISHFGVDCRDLPGVVDFYRNALHMPLVHQDADGGRAWLRAANGQMVCLTQAEQLTPMLTREPTRLATFNHHAHAALTIRKDEYLSAIEQAQAKGVQGEYAARGPRQGMEPQPHDPWYFKDPGGYGLHYYSQREPEGPEGQLAVQEFDHFTYEVADIEAVEQFYAEVLELPLHIRLGLNGKGFRHTFYWIGRHSIGFFQEEEMKGRRDPQHLWENPQFWAFRVTDAGFDSARCKLDQLEIEYLGPTEHPADWPIARSLRFNDPDGFSLELASWR
jgi:catechol 2,3-dioxygenase-like lactoylglutathione lyase family enzyme